MKKMTITATVLASALSLQAQANPWTYKCTTDTNKVIEVKYEYNRFNNDYPLHYLNIDGQSYRFYAQVNVERGGWHKMIVTNFRNNEDLTMTFAGAESSYVLGHGNSRKMNCVDLGEPEAPQQNDGI